MNGNDTTEWTVYYIYKYLDFLCLRTTQNDALSTIRNV